MSLIISHLDDHENSPQAEQSFLRVCTYNEKDTSPVWGAYTVIITNHK